MQGTENLRARARENALHWALQTATPGENPRTILERAADYLAYFSSGAAAESSPRASEAELSFLRVRLERLEAFVAPQLSQSPSAGSLADCQGCPPSR